MSQSSSEPRHAELPSGAAHPSLQGSGTSTGSLLQLSFSISAFHHFTRSGAFRPHGDKHTSLPPRQSYPSPLHPLQLPTQGALLTSVGSPDLLHAVPHEDDTGELREGLYHVEVAQGADLKERHAVLLRVGPGLLRGHLPLEGEVKPVPHQDPGDTRGMLKKRKKEVKKVTVCL